MSEWEDAYNYVPAIFTARLRQYYYDCYYINNLLVISRHDYLRDKRDAQVVTYSAKKT